MKKIFLLVLFVSSATFAFTQTEILDIKDDAVLHKFMIEKDSIAQLNIGKPYPEFHAISLDNEVFTDKYLTGKVTLINFWFEGCAPCVAEFADLNKLYAKYSDNPDFQFVSFTRDSPESAEKTKAKYNIAFPIFHISENENLRLSFNGGFPANIIVDKKGNTIFFKSGGAIEKDKVEKEIQLLEQRIVEAL